MTQTNIGNLAALVTADATGFTTAMKKAGDSSKRAQRRINSSMAGIEASARRMSGALTGIQRSAAGFVGVLATNRLVRFSNEVITSTDKIAKQADKIGFTTVALQELRFAGERSGLAIRTTDLALQRFSRRAAEAAQGTGTALGAFEEMGIALTDSAGRMRDVEDIYMDVAEAFATSIPAYDHLRLAFSLVDSEGAGMVDVFRKGRRGLEELRQQAHDTGNVINEDMVRQSSILRDELDVLGSQIRTNLTKAVLDLSPAIISAAEAFKGFTEWAQKAAQAYSDFADPLSRFEGIPAEKLEQDIADTEARLIKLGGSINSIMSSGRQVSAYALGEYDRLDERLRSMRKQLEAINKLADETPEVSSQHVAPSPRKPPIPKPVDDNKAVEAMRKAMEETRRSAIQFIGQLNPAIAAQQRYKEGVELLDRALKQGQITQGQYTMAIRLARQARDEELASTSKGTAFLQEFAEANEKAADSMKKVREQADEVREFFLSLDSPDQLAQKMVAAVAANNKPVMDMMASVKEEYDGLTDTGKLAADALGTFFQSAATDGLQSIEELGKAFVKMLAQVALRMAAVKLISATGFFGKEDGGIVGASGEVFARGGVMGARGALPFNQYARGGITSTPQMALFGEGSGNEAYIPLGGDTRVPVQLNMSKGGLSARVPLPNNRSLETRLTGFAQGGIMGPSGSLDLSGDGLERQAQVTERAVNHLRGSDGGGGNSYHVTVDARGAGYDVMQLLDAKIAQGIRIAEERAEARMLERARRSPQYASRFSG